MNVTNQPASSKQNAHSFFKVALFYTSVAFTIYCLISFFAITYLYENYRDQQIALAKSSSEGIKRNIESFVDLKVQQLELFAESESELLLDLIDFPADLDALMALDKKIHSRISNVFSYMLASPIGEPLLEEKLTSVGPICLAGIRRLAASQLNKPSTIVVHGVSTENYHFDIKTIINKNKKLEGVFFISFQFNNIIELLRNSQLPKQTLLLTKQGTNEIEVSSLGVKTSLFGLTLPTDLQPNVLFKTDIKNTGWSIISVLEQDNQSQYVMQLIIMAVALGTLLILLIVYFLNNIKRIEQFKTIAENNLIEHFNNLEAMVEDRTKELTLEKTKAEVTINSIEEGIITTDALGLVTTINPIAEKLIGCKANEMTHRHIDQIFHTVSFSTREKNPSIATQAIKNKQTTFLLLDTVLITHYGHDLFIESSCSPIINEKNDHILGSVLVFRDVTKQIQKLQSITHQAEHDDLTGLMNRKTFESHCRMVLTRLQKKQAPYVLLYMDLDFFKQVNDTAGHNAGDQLLKELSVKIQGVLRQRDLLSRRGGDEFSILLENCDEEAGVEIAKKIIKTVSEYKLHWKNQVHSVGISIGLASFHSNDRTLNDLLNLADTACYTAKNSGRNQVSVSVLD